MQSKTAHLQYLRFAHAWHYGLTALTGGFALLLLWVFLFATPEHPLNTAALSLLLLVFGGSAVSLIGKRKYLRDLVTLDCAGIHITEINGTTRTCRWQDITSVRETFWFRDLVIRAGKREMTMRFLPGLVGMAYLERCARDRKLTSKA